MASNNLLCAKCGKTEEQTGRIVGMLSDETPACVSCWVDFCRQTDSSKQNLTEWKKFCEQ